MVPAIAAGGGSGGHGGGGGGQGMGGGVAGGARGGLRGGGDVFHTRGAGRSPGAGPSIGAGVAPGFGGFHARNDGLFQRQERLRTSHCYPGLAERYGYGCSPLHVPPPYGDPGE